MKFCSLYSGSTGNSLFVESKDTRILVDAGVSVKKIIAALDSMNTNVEDIDAVIVTHEHIDHIKSIGILANKYNIPIYANLGTWNGIANEKKIANIENKNFFKIGETFEIGDLKINSFSTSHDAMDSCGFTIKSEDKKISIATDLGEMTKDVMNNLKNSRFLLLESNYEPELLKCCSYPYLLKRRIAGERGHLSNNDAGKTISKLVEYGLENVMLGHLSKESNFPELAQKTVINEMLQRGIKERDIELGVASRIEPSKVINI